ncbi:hypothetical protein HK104_007162 [Borealophlyctis nickersoniae]|nr:hypothetical protein HK104_007162 [Borealophlyctis nickersoniae]
MNVTVGGPFRNVPPATRALLVAALVLFCAGHFLRQKSEGSAAVTTPLLAVVPGSSLLYMWTFATAGIFESSLVNLVINLLIFAGAGRYFEQAWGSREYVKAVAIISVSSYVLVFLALFVEYALTLNPDYIFATQANGFGAIIAGFLIAFKQAIPEHSLNIARVFSIRVKHLPSVYMTIYNVLFLLRIVHAELYIVTFGAVTSWVYIRFFKLQDGIRGDRSEAFSFASFFPDFLHPFIKPLSNSTFALFCRLGLCKPMGPTSALDGARSPTVPPLAGTDLAEAERRRALALRALDMRLAQAPADSASSTSGASTPPRAAPELSQPPTLS